MKAENGLGGIVKLAGKRRKPYMIRYTKGYIINGVTGKKEQVFKVIGYASTIKEAKKIREDFNKRGRCDLGFTFSDIYEKWSQEHFKMVSLSYINATKAAYKCCEELYDVVFSSIQENQLQKVLDNSGKNYPTVRKIQLVFSQLYKFAIKNEICKNDLSLKLNTQKFKDRKWDKVVDKVISTDDINILWVMKENNYVQMILIMIYTGVTVDEFISLKKENVYLDKRYIEIVGTKSQKSKGIRIVPVSHKIESFIEKRMNDNINNEYLFTTDKGRNFKYRDFKDSYFDMVMNDMGWNYTPMYCRNTFRRLLAKEKVSPFLIKKLMGTRSQMSITEKVYIHPEIEVLIDAIDKL
ncbi:tyrosine-type recombinase/integrase [Thomasclavelia cocleata]|uniref:tyrosine-type recombinase/integrase n=1 Tax=Thomasclavelia cocleata TaxID=69824 RepID=UPI00242D2C55|nr:site-specific integrase [Thomasclavelia cocleata]